METNERMSKRFWLLGLAGLISAGLLVACGSNYNSSSNGLVLVGSQGSSVIQTFSFNLNNGHVASIANSTNDTGSETCVLNGSPGPMAMHPSGTYAYVIFNKSSQCPNATQFGIAVFQVKSDGTIAQVGNLVTLTSPSLIIAGYPPPNNTQTAAVNPNTLSVDAAGKFLFVANRGTTLVTPDGLTHSVPGSVSVLAIGSGGNLTEVAGSPFFVTTPATTVGQVTNDFVSVAATPTVFPSIGINGTQNSVCSVSSNPPPTTEFLYAVDTVGYQVFEFQVDTSSGALTVPNGVTAIPSFTTDAVPVGVAVDPCDRFLYVSGNLHNKINAYTICTTVIANGVCPFINGKLVEVPNSPFSVTGSANGLGPLVVDPYGNNVYVLGSNTVSSFKISPVSGSLTALTPATVNTGTQPTSIVIRGDDNWMFVTNYQSQSVSQYSITPATGALSVLPTITTDNNPFGVAVK
jgi:6-phosphogluconolactonase (cycloisomerase 2 family)